MEYFTSQEGFTGITRSGLVMPSSRDAMSMTNEETPLGFFCRAGLECWDEASFAQWATTVITHPKK